MLYSENPLLIIQFLTYIYINAGLSKDCCRRVISRNISVELVSVPVPLDTVQVVSLQVVITDQLGVTAVDGMRRDTHIDQPDTVTPCK